MINLGKEKGKPANTLETRSNDIMNNQGLKNNENLIFKGKDEIENATQLITKDFIDKNVELLNPNDSLFEFIRQTQNYANRDKILNHFADKMVIEDELGRYSGEGIVRFRYLNYIMPTLDRALIEMEKGNRIMKFKPFADDKGKITRFVSIIEDLDNAEFFVTAFKTADNKNLKRLMREADEVKFNAPVDTSHLSTWDRIKQSEKSNENILTQQGLK